MKITEEQMALINSLCCERLSSDEENFRLIDSFYSVRNNNVAEALLNEAYQEDESGVVAYYVVKDTDKNVLFFFSLKCGLLFDEFIEGKKLARLKELCITVAEKLNGGNVPKEDIDGLKAFLEIVRAKKGLKKDDVARILHTTTDSQKINAIFDKNIKNVGKTFAGVEIVHFCANDECREAWDKYGLDQSLGAIVFWHFIVPKIFELREIVGCEYLFLFAADCDPDEHLVNYYSQKLKFKKADKHSTAMPIYDFTCKFMYQEILDLGNKRMKFFENFNHDEDAV